jgi:hypothetical protein
MCEQCSAATVTFGEVLPGVAVIRATRDGLSMKAGQWGLVTMNDPFIIFDSSPVVDPAHGWTDDQVNASEDGHPMWAWHDLSGEFREKLYVPPRLGARLIEKATALGYTDDDGDLAHWLFHRMGVVVAANPNPKPPNPDHT